MKIVIAPDSFKNFLSASEICEIIYDAVFEEAPDVQIVKLPIADGGEGTLDALLAAAGGRKIACRAAGPEFTEIDSYYGLVGNSTAVIELAAVCGLGLMEPSRFDPEKTTTFGVGQTVKKALDDGCREIILFVGGSATNDAGIGALAALGMKFLDPRGNELIPAGKSLSEIVCIDTSRMDTRLNSCRIVIACDVDNPLCGDNGAAYVFAPQKGADRDMVIRLDNGLRHFAEVLEAHIKKDVSKIPGAGAAGGIAAGFIGFYGASLARGIDIVLDTVGFDERIRGADLIITGEGKTDMQTMSGKAVLGVTRRAKAQGIPVIVISGAADGGVDKLLYDEGASAVFSSCRLGFPFEEARDKCAGWLKLTVKNVLRTYLLKNH